MPIFEPPFGPLVRTARFLRQSAHLCSSKTNGLYTYFYYGTICRDVVLFFFGVPKQLLIPRVKQKRVGLDFKQGGVVIPCNFMVGNCFMAAYPQRNSEENRAQETEESKLTNNSSDTRFLSNWSDGIYPISKMVSFNNVTGTPNQTFDSE